MIRGWCPSLYEPMPTGDGLLVRVKPPGGKLTSAATRCLAKEVARFGNGIVELTGRGNLQVRGLRADGVAGFAAAMVAGELASADPAVERRRNVMAPPLAGCDPAAAGDAGELAVALAAMLEDEPALAALPAKFEFAVDGGGVLGLCEPADITIRSEGAQHSVILNGKQAPCPFGASVGIARDLAWLAGNRRMRECDAVAMFASVGLTSTGSAVHPVAAAAVGFLAYPGTEHGAFGFGLPFGQTDTATLARLAELAERFADGTLRLSPWRAILLGSVRSRDVTALLAAAGGLIVDASDRRLSMAACIGSAGCASGTVRARDDAAMLANTGWTGFLHVSGCAKGCAHPIEAAVTLVGDGGAYNLVRHGRADAAPSVTGLSLQQVRNSL